MTRIIGGFAGSLQLRTPDGSNTRPTSSRAREAIASGVDHRVELSQISVLDLYAGSGALGLEAVSRGAREAVFVDTDRKALETCKHNIRTVERAAPHPVRLTAQHGDALRYVEDTAADGHSKFGVIFCDPPYAVDEETIARIARSVARILARDGVFVLERASKSPEPTLPDGLLLERSKRYGDTAVHFIEAQA